MTKLDPPDEDHLTAHERAAPMAAQNSGPLQGVRIIDCTHALAGPWSTMMLADLGADVIKVEPPRGELARKMPPFTREDTERNFGAGFANYNRNKRGIALDLTDDDQREQFLQLVDTADALVENMRAGVMDALGVGWEILHERNPRLVYGAIRGFGDPRSGESPYVDWPAYDVVAQAMSGMVSATGSGPDDRHVVGPYIGDTYPGTIGAMGVLAALFHAQRTGEGQFVDVSMVDAVMALSEVGVTRYSVMGQPDTPPSGNKNQYIVPFDIFDTVDGAIAIGAPTDNHWRELAVAMGRPEWAWAEETRTLRARYHHRDEIIAALTEWAATLTNAEVIAAIGGKVPCGPVNHPGDLFTDPHVAARDMLIAVEQPVGRPIVQIAPPIRMSATPPGIYRRAPKLGEHNDEVLGELGEHHGEALGELGDD